MGVHVRALVRPGFDSDQLPGGSVEPWLGDLGDPTSLDGLCDGADLLFHLAASQNPQAADREILGVNVEGTRQLLDRAATAGVPRVLLASTGGVHRNPSGDPVTERSPLQPLNTYFRSKLLAEEIAREIFRPSPERLTIVRPGSVYGPGDRRFRILYDALRRGRFVMIGPGTRRIHPVYVDDLVDGLLLAASGRGAGSTYLMSGPVSLTLREWIEAVAREAHASLPRWSLPVGAVRAVVSFLELACRPFGVRLPITRSRLGFFVHHRCYDLTRARVELGYEPRIGVETGIGRTIAAFRGEGGRLGGR
jgi:nucleoside-diphosphate-sugar epimerase